MSECPKLAKVIAAIRSGDGSNFELPRAILTKDGSPIGELVPLTAELIDDTLCETLYQWRSLHASLFLSQFENSPARVRDWLTTTIMPDLTRQPFLIFTADGSLTGINGVCAVEKNSAELDTMMRGRSGGHLELMSASQMALIDWTFRILGVGSVYGRVLSRNFLVRRFHKSFGLIEENSAPLVKHATEDGYTFELAPNVAPENADETLITIRLDREAFYRRYDGIPALTRATNRSHQDG